MPLTDCPFISFGNGVYRPVLAVRIINPHAKMITPTYGIIDTGADDCAVPAGFAPLLGHNLQSGISKDISTGNGVTIAYSHMTQFEICNPHTGKLLYTVSDTPIDFLPNLHVVLLGVNSFLSKFILQIDYPNKTFSISKSHS